ncbi:MAG: hypothetical protein LBF86_02005 [Helicobacteraceae bacterium]|jgi:hypothetical protein|nr:hypothetical protein [Helicobacteraceae bacterium]
MKFYELCKYIWQTLYPRIEQIGEEVSANKDLTATNVEATAQSASNAAQSEQNAADSASAALASQNAAAGSEANAANSAESASDNKEIVETLAANVTALAKDGLVDFENVQSGVTMKAKLKRYDALTEQTIEILRDYIIAAADTYVPNLMFFGTFETTEALEASSGASAGQIAYNLETNTEWLFDGAAWNNTLNPNGTTPATITIAGINGIMPKEALNAIGDLTEAMQSLQGLSKRFVFTEATIPQGGWTQSQLTTFYRTASNNASDPIPDGTLLSNGANAEDHDYQYIATSDIWIARAVGIETATNDIAGLVKGSIAEGKNYVEADGTLSLNGYDAVKTTGLNALRSATIANEKTDPLTISNANEARINTEYIYSYQNGWTDTYNFVGATPQTSPNYYGSYALAADMLTPAEGSIAAIAATDTEWAFSLNNLWQDSGEPIGTHANSDPLYFGSYSTTAQLRESEADEAGKIAYNLETETEWAYTALAWADTQEPIGTTAMDAPNYFGAFDAIDDLPKPNDIAYTTNQNGHTHKITRTLELIKSSQTWIAPRDITARITLCGGSGGTGGSGWGPNRGQLGGNGEIKTILAELKRNDNLTIVIGQRGGNGASSSYGGGGGGGGGATTIYKNDLPLAYAVGGGGGGGSNGNDDNETGGNGGASGAAGLSGYNAVGGAAGAGGSLSDFSNVSLLASGMGSYGGHNTGNGGQDGGGRAYGFVEIEY